ncbi:MAG: outer membrane protein assembly factor BamE (lipoprotein component of BamABCDE complex) [Yoonia sp.]|jgi:outer membrane protein assembly factor BamE (lipoprotein component of BamABCDE complex)
MGIKSSKLYKSVLIVGLAALVSGCTPIERFHGFIPPEPEIVTLQVGITSKDDVLNLFGPPISDRALENNTIYYASSQFQYFGPFAPRVVDRQILAIDFDASDRVRNIARYTMEDGQVIVLDRRVTEDGISDVSFLSQLFGSFGRMDAATLLGER